MNQISYVYDYTFFPVFITVYTIYYYWLFGLGLLSISWTYTFFSLKLGIVPVSARCISTSTGYHGYSDQIIRLRNMADAQNSSD